jgi:hypothetical protein
MSANVDAMVNEGVNAFKAGRKEEARTLLLKATELDQYNEQAWLWLSGLMDGPDDQRTCLENVLAINPNNERAKQGLSYLTGTTSAGNPSPFAAGTPPPALSTSAPTSVEWGASDSPAMPAAWNRPAPPEPTPAALDDWVSNLNLPVNDAAPGATPAFSNAASAGASSPSPFGDFDMDDEDAFASGPFSASPLDLGEAAAPASSRRSPTPIQSPSPREPRRRRQPRNNNGSLLTEVEEDEAAKLQANESEMFGYIPPEIPATRLPGTHESTPVLLTVGVIVLVLLNIALAVVVMMGILT